jgi:hypothetical protein
MYLAHCCFTEQHQLNAAARLRLRGCVRHCGAVDVEAGVCDRWYKEGAVYRVILAGFKTWVEGGMSIWGECGGRVALGRLRGGQTPSAVTEPLHVMIR